jgi:hypothetical protein
MDSQRLQKLVDYNPGKINLYDIGDVALRINYFSHSLFPEILMTLGGIGDRLAVASLFINSASLDTGIDSLVWDSLVAKKEKGVYVLLGRTGFPKGTLDEKKLSLERGIWRVADQICQNLGNNFRDEKGEPVDFTLLVNVGLVEMAKNSAGQRVVQLELQSLGLNYKDEGSARNLFSRTYEQQPL